MDSDLGGGRDRTRLRPHLPGAGRVRRALPTRPSGPALGRAAALLLVVLGVAAFAHPDLRAVLGPAGLLAVVAGSSLLFVLVDPLGILRGVENRVLGALLTTLFPETAHAGSDPVRVADRLQRLLPELPWVDRFALRVTAWLLLVSPLVVLPSPRPFPLLDRRRREAVARAWGSTRFVPLRALFTLVKGTLAMVHFERQAVLETVGWTPADSGYREG